MTTHNEHAIPLLLVYNNDTINKPTSTEDTIKTCRICGEEEEEEEEEESKDEEASIGYSRRTIPPSASPLIRPCHCQGSMKYVHISCLNHWRTVSPRPSSNMTCDICGYEYTMYRPRYAALLTCRPMIRLFTLLLLFFSLLSFAYLCKAVDIYLLGHHPPSLSSDQHQHQHHHYQSNPNPDWFNLHGSSWWFGLDRFYLLGGLMVVAMIGLVYLTWVCVTQPEQFPYLIQSSSDHHGDGDDDEEEEEGDRGSGSGSGSGMSFLCCDQSSCPWYCCYLADFAICSGDSALGGILIFIVLVSTLVILFGVMGAVTGMFRLIESWVNYAASHIKDKIVDVVE